MGNSNKGFKQWVSFFLLGAALIILYKMFDNLAQIGGVIGSFLSILTPFIIGFGIAFLLYGPANFVEQRMLRSKKRFIQRIARPVSIVAAYLLLLGIFSLIIYLIIPAFISILINVIESFPEYYENLMGFLSDYARPGGFLEDVDIQGKVQELYDTLKSFITVDRILTYMQSVISVTSSIVDIFLALVVSIYMLLGRESLFHVVRSTSSLVFKPKTVNGIAGYLHKTADIFYNYAYSQLLDALVVSILATIGFLLARLPNAPALGLMLGIMNMVPYFGALIGGVLCVLMALLSGNFYGAVFVAIYIIVMQQIDANIIQPRIVGQTVGLKAIYVLLGITVFGGLFGFWGILLGAPFMAVIRMLLRDYFAYRSKKAQTKPTNRTPEL